jgi:hypothetical protein
MEYKTTLVFALHVLLSPTAACETCDPREATYIPPPAFSALPPTPQNAPKMATGNKISGKPGKVLTLVQ